MEQQSTEGPFFPTDPLDSLGRCTKCSKQLGLHDKFCRHCGAAQPLAGPPPEASSDTELCQFARQLADYSKRLRLRFQAPPKPSPTPPPPPPPPAAPAPTPSLPSTPAHVPQPWNTTRRPTLSPPRPSLKNADVQRLAAAMGAPSQHPWLDPHAISTLKSLIQRRTVSPPRTTTPRWSHRDC
eukprot:Sspe_Gene.41685::Locus_20168_Transcript_2_2_Confidence_0.500_Length_701::g.41685::m.41685